MQQAGKSPSKQRVTLESTLDFNKQDIDANRDGHISDRQRERLSQRRKKKRTVLIWTVIIIAAIYAAILLDTIQKQNYDGIGGLVMVTVFCGGVALLLGRGYVPQRQPLEVDLEQGVVKMVAGSVEISVSKLQANKGAPRKPYCLVEVEGISFGWLPVELASIVVNGNSYYIYYLPRSKLVLSAEPIGQRSQ